MAFGDVHGYTRQSSCRHDSVATRQLDPFDVLRANGKATRSPKLGGVVAVISIKMLRTGTGRAKYYLERDAECHPSGYYLEDAEQAGRWCGHGAAALGLAGPITGLGREAFTRLLDGQLPDGSQVMGPVLRQDPHGPEGARIDIRRCGIDLVISPPKSVSVLYALADAATAAAVVAAHEKAVAEALAYLERNAGHGVRGHQGGGQRATRIGTDGLVAAAFAHRTSRADDPQLHTHLVVVNLLHGVDGQWSAVDSRAMHLQARTAGCIYQATLRGELTRTLGVGWSPVRRGVAEMFGISAPLRKEFSKRRQAIDDELERTGTAGRKAAQRAAYVTRPAKSHRPLTSLRQSWKRRASDLGHPADQVVAQTLGRTVAPAWPAIERVVAEMFGPTGLTSKATSFDRRDVIQALTETLPTGVAVTADRLEAAADRLLTDANAIPLLQPAQRTGERRWSTRELLESEHLALNISVEPTAIPTMTRTGAQHAISRHRLTAEQREVVTSLLTSARLVDVVVGPAGSGKTAALRAAVNAWRANGVPVIGCSLAAITARRLEAATGAPCASIARTLADIDRTEPTTGEPAGLARNTVVLVDEASMVGTRQYLRLAARVRDAGGKIVAVGDPSQIAEVEAGGVFTALARDHEPLSLTGNQRQSADWEREALCALRNGDTDAALTAYLAHDRVHVGTAPSRIRRQLAADYLDHRADHDDPYAVIALATTRRDVAWLNTAIRDQLRNAGQLGPDVLLVDADDGDRPYAIGDLVLVTRNDHRAGLLNGTRAIVTKSNSHGLTLCSESGKQHEVAADWVGEHLDHGYAVTVHKAQGLTTQVALLYGASTLCQQSGYVGLSRGREANHLYTGLVALQGDHLGVDLGPDDEASTITAAQVISALADHLGRDRRQTLAHAQLPAIRQPDLRPDERRLAPYLSRDPASDRAIGRSR